MKIKLTIGSVIGYNYRMNEKSFCGPLAVVLIIGMLSGGFFLRAEDETSTLWTGFKHPIKFGHLSVEDGLSQSSVLTIFQDSKGFMWFGTEDGLNRYDGYGFKIFRPEKDNPYSISDNIIHCIFEDRGGRLWIGTNAGGLNRFDAAAERFFHYRPKPGVPGSLGSETVNRIYQDSKGTIWLGTGGGGLNKLVEEENGVTFINYQPDPSNPASFSDYNAVSIFEDRDGVLWSGTDGGGVNRMNPPANEGELPTFTGYSYIPGNKETTGLTNVMAIDQDRHGVMWFGTQNGLISFDWETGIYRRFAAKPGDRSTIGHNYVRTIYKDRAGVLWIGTDGGGVSKLITGNSKNDTPVFIHYRTDPNNPDGLKSNAVESIYEDRSGVLWIGLYRRGINKLILKGSEGTEREKEQFIHYRTIPNNPDSLSNNAVNAICEDRTGTLWAGTDGGGLNRILPPKQPGERLRFRHFLNQPGNPSSLSDNIVTCLCEDRQGVIWVGTYTGGLNRMTTGEAGAGEPVFTRYRSEPGNPQSLSNNFVMTIFEDRAGFLWIGTIDGGLNRMNKDTGTFKRFNNDGGNPESLSGNNVFAVNQDRAGTLWVGTMLGLNRVKEERFTRYRNTPGQPDTLSHDFVRVIYEDRSGVLWIGTNGGGLNKLVSGGGPGGSPAFRHFTVNDGLPNNVIVGILEDESGRLWISTKKGLSRFDPETGMFKNYDVRDGLQSDEFNRGAFFKNKSGEMFFGGNNGFNMFHPDRIRENTRVPPIVLTDFRLFGRPLPLGRLDDGRVLLKQSITGTREITLSHRDYLFSIHFAALHFVNPSNNRYAYKLEGLDDRWNDLGNRNFVTYTTLPHGDYVLKIRGTNNDGLWNNEGVFLKITVTPPFWKTWWFISLVVLLIILTVLGIHFYHVRQIIRKMEKKYEKTAMKPQKADAYLKILLNYMKMGKPYLDPDLNIHKLSKRVAIPYHYLSQIINNKLKKIFFDFINDYRIKEAIEKLKDPKENEKTIQQIAKEVGFNSQSAFNRAFKKFTEKTPSDFITQYRIEEAARRLIDRKEKNKSIQQIALDVGFHSQSTFSRAFKKITNLSPSEYRKKKSK